MIDAADAIAEKFGAANVSKENADDFFNILSITFEISEKTAVEVGPFNEGITISDLEDNREQILKNLRKKAHGILMNFITAEDFDFQSELPKYRNGMYEENIQRISGNANGSIREEVRVEAIVFNPNKEKVKRLLDERISILSINAITFGFSVPVGEQETLLDIGKKFLHRLQEEYIILSYDNNEGAKVEIGDNFYLSFMPSESVLKVRLSTKYDWQFEGCMKKFSVIDFFKNKINNLM